MGENSVKLQGKVVGSPYRIHDNEVDICLFTLQVERQVVLNGETKTMRDFVPVKVMNKTDVDKHITAEKQIGVEGRVDYRKNEKDPTKPYKNVLALKVDLNAFGASKNMAVVKGRMMKDAVVTRGGCVMADVIVNTYSGGTEYTSRVPVKLFGCSEIAGEMVKGREVEVNGYINARYSKDDDREYFSVTAEGQNCIAMGRHAKGSGDTEQVASAPAASNQAAPNKPSFI